MCLWIVFLNNDVVFLLPFMSVLLDKSNQNIRAAALLIDQHQCYSASIHCSYYSAFQRSAYILKNQFKMTDKDIELDAAFGNTGKDSHNKTISVVFDKISKAGERLKALDYRREMGELKGKRRKADYSDEVIDEEVSRAAQSQAQTIQKLLDNVFHLS